MTRIMTTLGGLDFDQSFQEITDRIKASKDGFIYLTTENHDRLFNTDYFIYVMGDYRPIESSPQQPIDHSVKDVEITEPKSESK